MSDNNVQSGGVGLGGLLFLLFLYLQLAGHVDWPWYAVAAPLWIPAALVLLVITVTFVGCLVLEAVDSPPKKARHK